MVNWKSLLKRIPSSINIKRNVKYEVVYVKEFPQEHTVGETRFHTKQIALKLGDTPRETVHTYMHEVLHAVSDAYGAGLTEAQVMALEKALYYILKESNILS